MALSFVGDTFEQVFVINLDHNLYHALPTLLTSDILPARGGPERAARPPPAVRRPKAGVNKWKLKLRVNMIKTKRPKADYSKWKLGIETVQKESPPCGCFEIKGSK